MLSDNNRYAAECADQRRTALCDSLRNLPSNTVIHLLGLSMNEDLDVQAVFDHRCTCLRFWLDVARTTKRRMKISFVDDSAAERRKLTMWAANYSQRIRLSVRRPTAHNAKTVMIFQLIP